MQEKQSQWAWQWNEFFDDNQWLFTEWIRPQTLEFFKGKDVLDCGCGGGQHLTFIAKYCKSALGVDLNATEAAKRATEKFPHIRVQEADIAQMDLRRQFDVVYSIGVLHHTDNPTASFKNITKHARSGGRIIVWVYSHEGNFLNRTFVEGMKNLFVLHMPRKFVLGLAHLFTILVYIPVYTLYLFTPRSLGLVGLPYYEYFQNWRKLSYHRNLLNVFDKLNAPQTHFIKQSTIEQWFNSGEFTDVHISPYRGVSWRGSGTKI